jgi:hypothetical protein
MFSRRMNSLDAGVNQTLFFGMPRPVARACLGNASLQGGAPDLRVPVV